MRFVKEVKAQGGTIAVAVLIMVMLVFLIIYLIALPPDQRARLLNTTNASSLSSVLFLFLRAKR
ncbi:MAG: hypothetical protein AABX59_01435 [Nanoarchaeota archaeon]